MQVFVLEGAEFGLPEAAVREGINWEETTAGFVGGMLASDFSGTVGEENDMGAEDAVCDGSGTFSDGTDLFPAALTVLPQFPV